MSKPKEFQAMLERSMRFVIIRVPFAAKDLWKMTACRRVKGTINGFPFRAALFGSAADGYGLVINKVMQEGAHAYVGQAAEFMLEPDTHDPVFTVPRELAKLLREYRDVGRWFETLNLSTRRYLCKDISKPESAEVRQRRTEKLVELLMQAMEGEQEPPPILKEAFRRRPGAKAGWEAMTPIQRRDHLLEIFLYQSPEARQRRAGKAVAEALRVAGVPVEDYAAPNAGDDKAL